MKDQRYFEESLPISFTNFDKFVSIGDVLYYDVEFTSDWGPFKTGDKFDRLSICLSNGMVYSYDNDGNTHIAVKFKLSPE